MKRIVLISFLILTGFYLSAQAPEGFSYQAVVRNDVGNLIITQAVSFRFNIIKGSPVGEIVYEDKHFVTTDEYGMVSLVIGNGTDKFGDFTSIDWGTVTAHQLSRVL